MGDPFDSAFRGTERFQILRCLGVGGMGVVYEALDTERQLRVALKTIKTLDPQHLLRFKSEFRALQGVEHPNLVTLFELQSSANKWFFTMELVEGTNLVDWVRGVRRIVVSDSARSTNPLDLQTPSHIELWSSETLPSSDVPSLAPPAPTYDERRLRDALQQLASGLAELHHAGKVHRDIKPSNVLVTPEGRVVVLDFGLVADLGSSMADSGVVGTALYMAPEQAAGRRPGPEADWYSVGVMLYEILTGKLPFDGPMLQVLQDKQRRTPLRPSALTPCPTDLEELCMSLLEPEPGMRATTDKILARVGAPGQRDRSSPTPLLGSSVFVGRNAELARLKAAFEKTRQGHGMVVVVEGPSGVGKSALVAHFTRRLVDRVPDAVILTGRYYEREAVPYRAFDGIMDAVARFLMRQPAAVADAMLPTDVGLLASLFPALRAVESVSRGSLRPPALDPHELRTKLFAAVRELFVRLARRRPVVLVIDDVQWSDADSRAIFAEAMRAPDGPPLLLIVTVRSAPDHPEATARVLSYLAKVCDVEHLRLDALAPNEAHDLASKLLGRERAELASTIAGEAEGHPLFIDALVRHALFSDPTGLTERPTTLRLDEALGATLDRLDDHARTLLELVSLSLRPLAYELARRAAGLDHAELPRAVTALRSVHLVRGARIRDEDALEPYHDRVREVVLGGLAVALRRQRHEELARVLEATSRADPEELFTHWRAAGNAERSLHYGVLAASKANEVLAFDRAARLYRIAIELAPDAESKRKLGIKLGEAYAASGRGPDAAHAFLAAVPGAPSDEALDLRRRAAEQLLRSGQFEEGLAEVRGVLQVVDLAMPATPRAALVSFLWNRARLAMRGKKWQEHELGAIANNALMRIDVCWSVAGVLSMVDTIRGANFQAIHLRLALDAGEPSRVARAMAVETGYSATVGSVAKARTAKQFAVATELCERVGTPYAIGLVRGCGGTAAGLEGRWRDCYALTKEAEEIFRNQCGNIAWELSTFLFFHVYALAFTGQLAELQARVPRILREAEERGDRYGQVAHRLALANMAWLAVDDVVTARRNAESAVGDFRTSFKVEHFWQMLALGQLELYVGDTERALALVEERWSPLAASLLLRVELTRLEAVHLRGRVALARALHVSADERGPLWKTAAATAKQLQRAGASWAQPLGLLLDAARQVQQGRVADAVATLRRAIVALEAADMYLYAAAAKLRVGELAGGDEGRATRDEAIAWMRREKIASPTRMANMLAPGFPLQAPPNGGK